MTHNQLFEYRFVLFYTIRLPQIIFPRQTLPLKPPQDCDNQSPPLRVSGIYIEIPLLAILRINVFLCQTPYKPVLVFFEMKPDILEQICRELILLLCFPILQYPEKDCRKIQNEMI